MRRLVLRVAAVALVVSVTAGCGTAALPEASRTDLTGTDTAAASPAVAVPPASDLADPAADDLNPATGGVIYASGGDVEDTTAGPTAEQIAALPGGDATASTGQPRSGSLAPASSFYEAIAADPDRQPGAVHQPWTPPSRPTPAPSGATDADVVALIHRYFAPEEWGRAAAIASCESGMRSVTSAPNRNGTRDWGVFQFNDGGTLQGMLRRTGYPETDLQRALDPEWNVRAAALYHAGRGPGGWSPWSCAHKLGIVAALWSPVPGPNANAY